MIISIIKHKFHNNGRKMGQEVKKVKFKYLFDKSYNPVYCTGGFGGITPKNEIVLNFFMERQPIPYSETREINPDGTLGSLIDIEPNNDLESVQVIRNVETGIIIDLDTAKDIYTWLGNNIKIIEEQK